MPLLWRESVKDELRCSFCHKSQDAVGKLISSPSDYPRAYICNECVAVCHSILQDESTPEKEDPFLGDALITEFFVLVEQWITRETSGEDASEELSRVRTMAQHMSAHSPTSELKRPFY